MHLAHCRDGLNPGKRNLGGEVAAGVARGAHGEQGAAQYHLEESRLLVGLPALPQLRAHAVILTNEAMRIRDGLEGGELGVGRAVAESEELCGGERREEGRASEGLGIGPG
jgi:hypothetical protein